MSSNEEIQISIENVRMKFKEELFNEGLLEYYEVLDKPLYQNGNNTQITDLLDPCVNEDLSPKTKIDKIVQQQLARTLAEVYRVTGYPLKSIFLLKWLYKLDEVNDRTKAILCRNLGKILLTLGEIKESEKYLNFGVEICQKSNELGLKTGLRRQLGILHAYMGKYSDSRAEIREHPKNFGKHSHSDLSVYTDKCVHALLDKNEFSKVTYYATEMNKLTQKYPYVNDKTVADWLLGLAYLNTDDTNRARTHIDRALQNCRASNYVEIEPDILLTQARWELLAQDNLSESIAHAKTALLIANVHGYKFKQSEILCFLGEVSLSNGDRGVAKEYGVNAFNSAWCEGPPYYHKNIVTRSKKLLESIDESPPIRFCSCFISYSHADKDFALKLYEALDNRDIPCWLDDHEIQPGDYFPGNIDDGIKQAEKVLLCCSQSSLTSFWVDAEIDKALQKEEFLWKKNNKRTLVMIPLDLDGYVHNGWSDPKASVLRYRLSANFVDWKQSDDKFATVVEKVISALRVSV